MKILKQVIDVIATKTYNLPGTMVKPLCVKEQRGNIVLYFTASVSADELFDNSSVRTPVTIHIVGTGHERDDIDVNNYLGTVKLANDSLMFHCFYKNEISQDL